ncbi:hypothetical protein ABT160_02680 [Streptomyces sp. NPDC001941]|uniref:hypothetical protein n=1 Tax=Streptomyces sp. NPDC001941 TaxID=3154659 RepID=UPI003328791E
MSQTDDPMVAALLRERAGYVARGLDDRVAAVDEQLALRGYSGEAAPETQEPEGRATPQVQQSTAEGRGRGRGRRASE